MATIDIAVSVKSQSPKISKAQYQRLMEKIKQDATCAEIGRICSAVRKEFRLSVLADLPAGRFNEAIGFIDELKRPNNARIKECLLVLEKDVSELVAWTGQIRDSLKVIRALM